MLRPLPFIVPAQPTLRVCPPAGDAWLHEVKFDGYRCQLHRAGKDVVIFSRYAERMIMWSAPPPDLRPALLSTA